MELEAYGGPEDRASHARAGRTARTAPMFGPAGHAYVYLVYGMHDCLNIVTGEDGEAGAVLIRAVEPLAGVAGMRSELIRSRARRWASRMTRPRSAPTLPPDERLGAGPGLLCTAFGIDRSFTGLDLCSVVSPLRIEIDDHLETRAISRTARVGVSYAGEPWASMPWRLLVSASPSVSGRTPRPGQLA